MPLVICEIRKLATEDSILKTISDGNCICHGHQCKQIENEMRFHPAPEMNIVILYSYRTLMSKKIQLIKGL